MHLLHFWRFWTSDDLFQAHFIVSCMSHKFNRLQWRPERRGSMYSLPVCLYNWQTCVISDVILDVFVDCRNLLIFLHLMSFHNRRQIYRLLLKLACILLAGIHKKTAARILENTLLFLHFREFSRTLGVLSKTCYETAHFSSGIRFLPNNLLYRSRNSWKASSMQFT